MRPPASGAKVNALPSGPRGENIPAVPTSRPREIVPESSEDDVPGVQKTTMSSPAIEADTTRSSASVVNDTAQASPPRSMATTRSTAGSRGSFSPAKQERLAARPIVAGVWVLPVGATGIGPRKRLAVGVNGFEIGPRYDGQVELLQLCAGILPDDPLAAKFLPPGFGLDGRTSADCCRAARRWFRSPGSRRQPSACTRRRYCTAVKR